MYVLLLISTLKVNEGSKGILWMLIYFSRDTLFKTKNIVMFSIGRLSARWR